MAVKRIRVRNTKSRVKAPKPTPKPIHPARALPPHPSAHMKTLSPRAKRNRVIEKAAEIKARQLLRKLGYSKIRRLQYDKIHGIDLAGIKSVKGRPVRAAVAEVKGSAGRAPTFSRLKKQVRGSYIEPRLRRAALRGVPNADKIYKLYKKGRVTSYGITYGLGAKETRVYRVPRRGRAKEILHLKPNVQGKGGKNNER